MQDLTFSEKCCLKFKSYALLSYVNGQIGPYVLEDNAASHLECLTGHVFLGY